MAGESQSKDPLVRPDLLRSRRFALCLFVAVGMILRLYVCYANDPTVEETHSMVVGLYGLRTGDFRLSDNIPPIAQMLGAVPSLALHVELTPSNQFHRFSEVSHSTLTKVAESVIVTNSSVFFSLLFLSRMVTLLWWAIGAWIICRWSYELFGENAQFVALTLWCFEPSIFARSCLATQDLCMGVTSVAATYLFQQWLMAPSINKALGVGFLFGIAQLIDFSALLLVVLWPVLLIAYALRARRLPPSSLTHWSRVRQAALGIVTAIWLINAGYGLSGMGFLLGEKFQAMNSAKGAISRLLGSLPVPLTPEYVDGIALRLRMIEDRPLSVAAWTDGIEEPGADQRRFSISGLFARISIGLWLMVPCGLALAVRRVFVDPQAPDALAVWIPLLIIPPLAMASPGLLVPMSAILIVLPFVIIGVSGLAGSMKPGQWKFGGFAAACLALVVASGLFSYPRPLAFINELVALTGGLRARVHHAIPGDMGQDILPLKVWRDQHSEAHALGLACRYVLDPSSYGLASTPPPIKPGPWLASFPWHAPRIGPFPGYYALDLWNLKDEKYSYFLQETPVARVGTSTHVYQITPQAADRIRRNMNLPSLQDIHSLDVWLEGNPKVRPLGLLSRHALDPRTYKLEFDRPPVNPGPEIANAPWYTLQSGPIPGDYIVDVGCLGDKRYDYFKLFKPIKTIGSSFHIYHLDHESVDHVRMQLGLPRLSTGRNEGRGFVQKDFVDSQGISSHYGIFTPSDYDGKKPYPLILFLHGAGDAGTDDQKYLAVGFPPFVEARKDSFGFIVLCPQGQTGGWPVDGGDANRAIEILDLVQREYNVDPNRVYLTGLSSGGQGTWDLAARYSERWAAIVPVSSSGADPANADKIKDIPCWCFHNKNDRGSPPEIPKRMLKALQEFGSHPRYSEFPDLFVPGARHNAWDAAYNNDDLYQWLILQSSSR